MIKVRTAFTLLFGVIIVSLIITTTVFLKLLDNRKGFGRMQFTKHAKLQLSHQIAEKNNDLSYLFSQYLLTQEADWKSQYQQLKNEPSEALVDYQKYHLKDTVFRLTESEIQLLQLAQEKDNFLRQLEADVFKEKSPTSAIERFSDNEEEYQIARKQLLQHLEDFDDHIENESTNKWNKSSEEGYFYFYVSLSLLLSILLFSCISFILIRKRVKRQEQLDLQLQENIEEIKATKNELEKSDERFQLAIKGSKALIWDFDTQQKKIKWFPKGKDFLDYDAEELGTDLQFLKDHIHKDDVSLFEKEIKEHKETRKPIAFDARFYSKNKELRWLRCQGLPVFDENTKALNRIVGTFVDITDELKAEEKIVNAVLETEDKERSRIARDIHDSLQQTMSTALLHLEKVRHHQPELNTEEHFQLGYSLLKKSIKESRSLAHNLMPKVVEENGIVPALQSLIAAMKGSTDTQISFFENIGEERLKLSYEISIYRIVQESINNMMKHSKASECTLQLMKYPDLLVLTIEDNGVGFDTSKTDQSFGINSLKTRASAIGAYLQVSSNLGKGTEIFLELAL
ncbi:PAS domain-containing protein [Flammeovirga sp. MY04]|uniref:sensor histidine kinase n=1 Tax=Flammeovirga sp. MY04 TaxID=1191459 RepID=UPI000825977E|nr:PAS domain-containing protein [Flammeovirga sp. MY04]ANQ51146.2 PAS domain-containing protein [Flammeovirga sp. MY04]